MIEEKEIYQCATSLIKQHGDEADIEAALMADALLDKGDMAGARTWVRIMEAVVELMDTKRPERVN